MNEEASDKVLEVEQKYNEVRRPVYLRRNDIIKSIPDFWLTAVSNLSVSNKFYFLIFQWLIKFPASMRYVVINLEAFRVYDFCLIGPCSSWAILPYVIFWLKKTRRLGTRYKLNQPHGSFWFNLVKFFFFLLFVTSKRTGKEGLYWFTKCSSLRLT